MQRYLVRFSYTQQGLEGLSQEGGTARREAVQQLAESFGGSMEAFYFAFGEQDGVIILSMPDEAAMIAALALVNRSGAVTTTTSVLLTPEEIDEAMKRTGTYRAPGQ